MISGSREPVHSGLMATKQEVCPWTDRSHLIGYAPNVVSTAQKTRSKIGEVGHITELPRLVTIQDVDSTRAVNNEVAIGRQNAFIERW